MIQKFLLLSMAIAFLTRIIFADTAVEERPDDLPRVLLLGDSISMGYDQPARKLLAGRATVHRPPENCQSTQHGLKKIEAWLGDGLGTSFISTGVSGMRTIWMAARSGPARRDMKRT